MVTERGALVRQEWRTHWPMVVAAVAGFSLSTLSVHSMGVFLGPIENDLGWTRAQITSGLTMFAILAAPLAPFAGALIDRYGARRLALPGIVLFSATFASFGLVGQSLTLWWAQWSLLAVLSLTVHTVIWTSAVASRFVHSRGLALGLTLCGTSLTQIIAPPLANQLIAHFGWRQAYVFMGAGWGAVALLLVFLFFHDALSAARNSKTAAAAVRRDLTGLTLGEALRSVRMWRIGATELFVSTINLSLIVHFVPLLISNGIDRTTAASTAGMVGVMAVAGKLGTGWLLDRYQGTLVPTVSMLLPAIASTMLLTSTDNSAMVLSAAAIFGFGVGAYFQVVTYLTTQYAGLANFGKIFGIMGGFMALGTGIGPLLAGHVYDLFGSYRPWLLVVIGLSLSAGLLVTRLGPYPNWAAATARD